MSLRVKLIQSIIHLNENLIFYPRLKRYFKSVLKNREPTVVDVGVNKGQTIDFFLKLSSETRVFGFEPNQQLFRFLTTKYHSNNRIQLFQNGISSEKGRLVFHENIMDETSTFEQVNTDSEYLKNKAKILGVKNVEQLIVNRYEVDVWRLSDFLKEHHLTHVNVLKIDTEGHEFDCLKGLFEGNSECKIDFIQLESHNDDMYSRKSDEAIDALLRKNHFQLDARIKHGFGGIDELIYKRSDLL